MTEPRLLRPLDARDLCNEAFDLYKRNFVLLAGIGAVAYVPYALLAAWLHGSGLVPDSPLVASLFSVGLGVVLVLAGGAAIRAVADRYLGRETSAGHAWLYVLRRALPLLLTTLLGLLALVGRTLLWIVPPLAILVRVSEPNLLSSLAVLLVLCILGTLASLQMLLLSTVIVLEGRYYGNALRRSRELLRGQVRRLLATVVFASLLLLVTACTTFFLIVFAAAVRRRIDPLGSLLGPAEVSLSTALLGGLRNAVLEAVIAPIPAIVSVLLYFDLRVRKEGFDVALLAEEIAADA